MTTKENLIDLIGKKVVVWAGKSSIRNSFKTAISIIGILENTEDLKKYRILINDQTYSYFKINDVEIITGTLPGGQVEKDGAVAVIKINI